MLKAIIDMGSNTIRLVVYRVQGGEARQVMKRKAMVGLASHVKDGLMQPSGIEAATRVLTEFNAFLRSFGIDEVITFTTAALRNARNSAEAVAAIERGTGRGIRVLTGDEEASLEFLAATHDLHEDSGLLADIGGGSTELVCYRGRRSEHQVSLPLGSLSLRTRFLTDILPTTDEAARIRDAVRLALSTLAWTPATPLDICGLGGTFKSALALYQGAYGTTSREMDAAKLFALANRFRRDVGVGESDLALLMSAAPDRMHTLFAGLAIAECLVERFGGGLIVYSDSGVREGLLLSLER